MEEDRRTPVDGEIIIGTFWKLFHPSLWLSSGFRVQQTLFHVSLPGALGSMWLTSWNTQLPGSSLALLVLSLLPLKLLISQRGHLTSFTHWCFHDSAPTTFPHQLALSLRPSHSLAPMLVASDKSPPQTSLLKVYALPPDPLAWFLLGISIWKSHGKLKKKIIAS